MSRLNNFNKLITQPHQKKLFARLNKTDVDFCYKIINETIELNKNDYASKVVRLWLDKPKPKNWTIIEELLISL